MGDALEDAKAKAAMTGTDPRIVEQVVRVHARPETVWRYWTDPERMCAWWGVAAELDPRPGGRCRVELDGGGVMRGEYVEVVPHERIVFSFGWEATAGAPAIPPGSTLVEITLAADGDDTVMTLRHTGIPPDEIERHRAGWAHFVPLLAAAAGRARLAMTIDVVTEVVIERPVAQVAAYAADPANVPAWYRRIETVEWKTEPPVRVGTNITFVAHFLGRRLAYTYEVAELVPGELLVMRTSEGPFPMETTYTWAPTSDAATRMTLRNRGAPSGFPKLLAPMIGVAVRRANRQDLARLKTILERD